LAAACVAGDKFLLGETDMTRSMYFGLAGGVGVYAAQIIGPMFPVVDIVPNNSFTDSKTLELRLLEVASATGVGFAINKFVLNNDPFINIQYNRIAVLAGADFVAEYIDDYMAGRALSYFK